MDGFGGAIGMALVAGIAFFFLAVAIGAVVLRIACGIAGVSPAPELGRAMIIVLANGAAVFAASAVLGAVGLDNQLFAILISAGTSTAIYSSMIPTTPSKALMIWLAQILVVIAVSVTFGVIFGGSMLMMLR